MLRCPLKATGVAAIGLLTFLAIAAAAPANAQWFGEISSSVLSPIPAKPAFDVTIYDDTKQNLEFRRVFLDALSRAGYEIGDAAPLVFSFATSITWQQKRQREVQSERIRKYPVERDETVIPFNRDPNYQSSSESRMFGDQRTAPPQIAPKISNAEHDRLDISVTLRERKTNKVLWIADLALPLIENDRNRIVRSIIGPIIGSIGRDIDHEPFEVN